MPSAAMRVSFCGLGVVGLLAVLAATAAAASQPKRALFRVTVKATVTKSWNTVTQTTLDGCPAARRSVGRRTITLRSARPTPVVVTSGTNRVFYSPPGVRFVTVRVAHTGSRTTQILAPCASRTIRSVCAPLRRSVSDWKTGFFRSGRNEVSFRPKRLPSITSACPGESVDVREIEPGLEEAEGEVSERAFFNPRIGGQAAHGSVEVTTDLEGAEEEGRVVERVNWALTFTRPA